MKRIITLATLLQCLRCGHHWRPEKLKVTMCPRCKSVHWDEAKKEK